MTALQIWSETIVCYSSLNDLLLHSKDWDYNDIPLNKVRNYRFISYFSTKAYVVCPQIDDSFDHPKQMLKLMDKKTGDFLPFH